MLNFSNLNDIEFEYLCNDVMSRKLDINFQRFPAGRDGGIDLLGFKSNGKIVIQVKHYKSSSYSNLVSSLKKEIPKVKRINPSNYYICCSMKLTLNNKTEIFEMFSNYMDSIENVIDLINISDFLDDDENKDILKKHFKLWIASTNILTNMLSNDIFIDSEVLISNIDDDVRLFVKTSAFDEAIRCLEKNNVLMIVGNPGVGKTITSKMIVLNYAGQGYKVRFTTDVTHLSNLKKALSQNLDEKEIILLDDCFGQAYFNMKETQENELIQLIKFVYLHSNKKLLLNSRITIYQEAKARTLNLLKTESKNEFKVFTLNVSNISKLDKAKIFYNHLYFCGIPHEYQMNIIKEKRYFNIIEHDNYNPRIIEFVTNEVQYESVDPDNYYSFIMNCLNNPKEVWENEYHRRLEKYDRIFLNTLYSLTNLYIPLDIMKKCFNKRISSFLDIDTSIDYFNNSLKRLNGSMVKLIDVRGIKMISVTNPSVNDFLSQNLKNIPAEKDNIIRNSLSVHQFERLLDPKEFEIKIKSMLKDHSIVDILFDDEKQKKDYIFYCCLKYKILDVFYKEYIVEFLLKPHEITFFDNNKFLVIEDSFGILLDNDFFSYYHLENIIYDMEQLDNILSVLSLEEAVDFINKIDNLFGDYSNIREEYIDLVKDVLKKTIEQEFGEVDATEYCLDIDDIVEMQGYEAEDDIIRKINEIIHEEINYYLDALPYEIEIEEKFIDFFEAEVKYIDEAIDDCMNDNSYSSSLNEYFYGSEDEDKEIELIFARE